MTEIRPATIEDFPEMLELQAQLDEKHYKAIPHLFRSSDEIKRPQSVFENALSHPSGLILVACKENKVIGFIHAEIQIDDENEDNLEFRKFEFGNILSIVVDYKWKRKGIGRRLFKKAEEWFKDKGVAEVEFGVFEFNKEAIHLYEHLGYSTRSRIMTRSLG